MDESMITLYESVPYQVYCRTVPAFVLQKMIFYRFLNHVAQLTFYSISIANDYAVQICGPNKVADTVTKTTGWGPEELWFDSQ